MAAATQTPIQPIVTAGVIATAVKPDAAQQRQAERDPEREPAVIGDIKTGNARSRLSTGGQRNAPSPARRGDRGQKARRGTSGRRVTTASGASQIKVASPANPAADSFKLCTPNARARLGCPRRWLP